MRIHLDFETRSILDLKKTGVYVYGEHWSTDLWCAAYAVGDEEPRVWRPGDPVPGEIADNIRDLEIHAWNAQFERVIWWLILCPRYGWPRPEREQFWCTAADAAALALPRALDQAGQVLGLETTKDLAGHRLMLQMARPRKPRKSKGEDPDGLYWWDEPEKVEQLIRYCQQDVRVERAIAERIKPLSERERKVYLVDQVINDRGIRLDLELVRAAQAIVDEGLARANAELDAITEGRVKAVTQVEELKRWVNSAGVELLDARKDTIRDLLAVDEGLDEATRRVLELRSFAAKSSTSKLGAMMRAACSDSRLRGLLLYHGASTGRWAGKLVQPQNMPRGEYFLNGGTAQVKNPEQYIESVLAGDYDAVDEDHPALVVIAALLRSMLVASPGHRLIGGDYAQIEARVLAWIAEQDDLVRLFAEGGKIYEEMASVIFGKPVESISNPSFERQVGKNTVLGCGYQMGAQRYREQAKEQTGIDLDPELCETAVASYRTRFAKIPEFWKAIEQAAFDAVAKPGRVTRVGRNGSIKFVVRGQFLWCVLPSGRALAYALPRLADVKTKWGVKTVVTFCGIDSYTRKWRRRGAYGGLWTENVVQAMARDLIAGAILRAEEAGYRPVLTVHDEVLCDTPNGHGSVEGFEELMAVVPRWADGLPVSVEAWEGERYRK